ncbi:indole-3-glycerol phosphate synthase TrpC [Ginsengibacter hankyongi]|uniref:indole-3-glycerol-phosphate synthase n=1 Tax=Ginsengibacter hankyongi TaxID=2607284 RepID=A0A5J5IJP8_9BACT|nr:indole-3-glycerol phosphate synthase TrpC [Ginsengibacter hankyongi]KAA9041280.1 indole-3-glycerol phosphate synthase TrpC [Ginsengibacter hankyongi]
MNILDTIIAKKKIEVAERKRNKSISELENGRFFRNETLSFKEYLLREDKTGIIAEYKRKSPSKGIINDRTSVTEVTTAYAKYGASAISVLTDEEFFGGSLNDLLESTINEVPLLRKDFIIDEYQLIESKSYGAAVILLIAACLTKDEVKTLASLAKNIGLNVLLEIHNEQELAHICNDVDVVGVNNRDLKSFTVDINRSIELSNQIPAGKVKISESGIDNAESIKLLKEHGFNGFLIGERFMKEEDPGAAFQYFAHELGSVNKMGV